MHHRAASLALGKQLIDLALPRSQLLLVDLSSLQPRQIAAQLLVAAVCSLSQRLQTFVPYALRPKHWPSKSSSNVNGQTHFESHE